MPAVSGPTNGDQLQHARHAGEENGVGNSQRREHDGIGHKRRHGEQHQGADVLGDQQVQIVQDLFGQRLPVGLNAFDDGVAHEEPVLEEEEAQDRNEHQRYQISEPARGCRGRLV